MESKLEGLREGEYIGIDVLPTVPGMRKLSVERKKELFLNEIKDNIGKGFVVHKGSLIAVAVLLDIDFDTDPTNKRYIFVYFDTKLKIDVIVDTLFETGWTCYDIDVTKDN